MPLPDFRGPDALDFENRYMREQRVVEVHPLTTVVLAHGSRTLRAVSRLRGTGDLSPTGQTSLGDLELLTYRLASKTHRVVAGFARLDADDDLLAARREVEVSVQEVRALLDDMCQVWTTIFLDCRLEEELVREMRASLAEVESHLATALKAAPWVRPRSSPASVAELLT